jgi:hypothetical protein
LKKHRNASKEAKIVTQATPLHDIVRVFNEHGEVYVKGVTGRIWPIRIRSGVARRLLNEIADSPTRTTTVTWGVDFARNIRVNGETADNSLSRFGTTVCNALFDGEEAWANRTLLYVLSTEACTVTSPRGYEAQGYKAVVGFAPDNPAQSARTFARHEARETVYRKEKEVIWTTERQPTPYELKQQAYLDSLS